METVNFFTKIRLFSPRRFKGKSSVLHACKTGNEDSLTEVLI